MVTVQKESLAKASSSARSTSLWLLREAAKTPIVFIAIAVMYVLRAIRGFDTAALNHIFGIRLPLHHLFPNIFFSGLTANTEAIATLSALALLTLGLVSERVLGSRRFVAVAVVIHFVGTAVGLALATIVWPINLSWSVTLTHEWLLSPIPWLSGVICFASAQFPALWRRRVRILVLAPTITMFLYSGVLSDFVQLTSCVLGVVFGYWVATGKWIPRRTQKSSTPEMRKLIAIFIFCVGSGPMLASLQPYSAGPLSEIAEFVWVPSITAEQATEICAPDTSSLVCHDANVLLHMSGVGPFLSNMMPLIITLAVCLGLMYGRRFAWWLALALHSAIIVAFSWMAFGLSQELFISDSSVIASEAIVAVELAALLLPWVAVIALLIWKRRYFTIASHRSDIARFSIGAAIAFAATSALWFGGVLAIRDSFQPRASFVEVFRLWIERFIPPAFGDVFHDHLLPQTWLGWWLMDWVGVIFWIAMAVLLVLLFRRSRSLHHDGDFKHAEEILTNGTGDHLSWMTLWDGNRYWFTDGGYVAYRVHNLIAVTLGEPVVYKRDKYEVAQEFEKFAEEQGWHVAWYSVRKDFIDAKAAQGWRDTTIAEEAVVHTKDAVEFKGKGFQDIRTARNRAKKENISIAWGTWDELPSTLREGITLLSEDWVSDKALPELGFTLGDMESLRDPRVTLMVAYDQDQHCHGVTSWLPAYKDGDIDGLVLDFMRRDSHGFRPVIELLIAETMLQAHDDGVNWVSLSGAPLAAAPAADRERSQSAILDMVLNKMGELLEPLYGFRSLAAFKKKFHPEHNAWVLGYRDELALPTIGIAVSKCYFREGESIDVIGVAKTMLAAHRSHD